MPSLLAGICLALAANGTGDPGEAQPVFVPARAFTLSWTHSIEKTRWEEDYAVEHAGERTGEAGLRLHAAAARVRGSGAGMEPPQGAVHKDGWYHYRPATGPLEELLLTRSAYAADYEWCDRNGCRPLSALLPSDGGVTRLWPCRRSRADRPRPIRPAG